jgi:hypothetical protein
MTITDEGPQPDRVEAVEVILDVGGEGGALTIEGTRTANGWHFRAIRNEYALSDFLSGEDRDGFEFWSGSGWLASWDRALSLFDKYPWHRLYPVQVHPDFRRQVWAAVEERYRTDKRGAGFGSPDRWRRLCHREAD